MRRRTLLGAALAAPALAQAPAWPGAGPVRIVVPFAAGGPTDIVARMLAEHAAPVIGQTMIVENRGGAAATLGSQHVARAAPDGYTLLVTTISGMAVAPVLYRGRVNYDPVGDFAHIVVAWGGPYLLMVNPRVPVRTLAEYLDIARSRGIEYATSGIGSMPHLLALRLAQATGANLTHVPYRSGAQAATDAIAGVVRSVIDSLPTAVGNMRSGALRAIAITSPQRLPAFPDLPTFNELGLPQIEADGWAGIAAPARTPRPIQERLAAAFRHALNTDAVQRRFADLSVLTGSRYLDDAQDFVRREVAAWGPVVEASGATAD
jgi:tripartite-type tricarboxylate transporter receptor subunit TctC